MAYSLEVGDWPTAVALWSYKDRAYVVNARSNTLSVVERLRLPAGMPAPRTGALLLADPRGESLVVHGGQTDVGVVSDTWRLDLAQGTWRQLETDGLEGGLSLAYPSVVGDPASSNAYLFGGIGRDGVESADLVQFSSTLGGFTQLGQGGRSIGPPARKGAALAYLPGRRAIYLFGGEQGDRTFQDSWLYSLDQRSWRALSPDCARQPCPSGRAWAMAFGLRDEERVAILGGRGADLEVWLQDLATGEWAPPAAASFEPGVFPGGLLKVAYLGKRLDRRQGAQRDETPLMGEFERGPNRSFRWLGQLRIDRPGAYRFGFEARGGMRLFLDGELVGMQHSPADSLGACRERALTSQPVELSAGWHELVVDLTVCRRGGHLRARFAGGPAGGQEGEGLIPPERFRHRSSGGLLRKGYFPLLWWWLETGLDFDPTPADDDWGTGAPAVLGVRWPNHFAVGWEGWLRIERAGQYRFVADTGDGALLEVAGQKLVDDLWGRAGERLSAPVWLETGWHAIRFVALDRRGSAHARLRFHESSPELGGQKLPASRCSADMLPSDREAGTL